ncbi:MAG: hypothetical protein Kow00121_17940 [Elainellaceae cyanobacterium]
MSEDSKTSIFRQESLERLSSPEQLDQLMQIVTPKSWLPLATLGCLVLLGLIWSIVGRIPITATAQGVLVTPADGSNELVALSFFDPKQGDRIQPGMQIIIVPELASSERIGGILGRVTSVSEPSIRTLDAARQAIATEPTAFQNEAIEIVAELEPDPDNPSGYQWSSLGGEGLTLVPGTTTTNRITLDEKAPISFIFPF